MTPAIPQRMQMNQTSLFRRLPPDAAIPFGGFEYARIPSREQVVSNVQEFITYCLGTAKSPAVRVILGEWGEGKSEAFARYIKPNLERKGHDAISVDAKTIANSYRYVETLSPLPADQFLAAVFYSLRSQGKAKGSPALERFADLRPWLSEFLSTLTTDQHKKVFVFIDEFEDLILEPDALKKILAGLKATINGQFEQIADGGQFQGSVFFFVSCTPDAYNKMRNDPEIAQVFGSYDRRVNLIDLPPISASEALHFLWNLFAYAYDKELPAPLPIASAGVLQTIYTIGKGNIGALVTLVTRLLNKAQTPDKKLRVIDYEFLLEVLPTQRVAILGSTWPCIEKPFFDSLLQGFENAKITKGYYRVFKLLACERVPFTVVELAARTGIEQQMIGTIVREMNKALRSIGISEAIVPMVGVESHWDFREIFAGFVEGDVLKIGEFKGSIAQFLQDLEFPVLNGSNLEVRMFFPSSKESIQNYFRDLSSNAVESIFSRLPKVDAATQYYCLSPELVAQLYPSPAPPSLDYVKNPELKAEVWRRVSTDFERTLKHLGVSPFVQLIRMCRELPIRVEGSSSSIEHAEFFQIRDSRRDLALNVFALSCFGNLTGQTFRSIQHLLSRGQTPIHTLWIFYTGEQTTSYSDLEQFREIVDRTILFYVHPTLTKRFMAGYLFSKEHPTQISASFFERAVRELLITELRFPQKWEEWQLEATRRGLAIGDLVRTSSKSERDVADAMKFYLNCVDESLNPEEVFASNLRLRAVTVFDTKIGLIPDIESTDQLQRLTSDLQANKLVNVTSAGIKIISSQIEQRILAHLSSETESPLDSLKSHFMIVASYKPIIEQFYIPLLEFKGQIVKRKGGYSRVRRQSALDMIASRMKAYDTQIDNYKRMGIYDDAHVYVTKKRDDRLIKLEGFDNCVRDEFKKLSVARSDEFVLTKIRLVLMLLQVFDADLNPKFQLAQRQRQALLTELRKAQSEMEADLNILTSEFLRWTNFELDPKRVREFQRLSAGLTEVAEAIDCRSDVFTKSIERLPPEDFSYKTFDDQERSFDIRVFQAQMRLAALKPEQARLHNEALAVEKLTIDLKRDLAELESKITTLVIPTDLKLANTLKEFVRLSSERTQVKALRPPETWDLDISLQDIASEIRHARSSTDEIVPQLSHLISIWRSLTNAEGSLVRTFANASHSIEDGLRTIDVEPYTSLLRAMEHRMHRYHEAYESLQERLNAACERQLKVEPFSEILTQVERLDPSAAGINSDLEQIWEDFKREMLADINNVNRALSIMPQSAVKQQIGSQLTELRSRVEQSTYAKTSRRMSDFKQILNDIRSTLRTCLASFLSAQEVSVFEALGSAFPNSSAWISSEELATQISVRTKLSPDCCLQQLRSLMEKGLIIQGFRLAT